MADSLAPARQAIEARLRELDEEAGRLREALSKLKPSGPAGTSRPRQRQRRRASARKRAPRGERQSQFLAALEEHPGAKPPEIAREMGVPSSHVYTLARRLHSAGKIQKRRGGGYSVKT